MLLESPLINYKSISINSSPINMETTCHASFNPPFNKIDVIMTPTNCSLNYYEVRVTRVEDAYDIGVGNLAYWDTNIAWNADHSFSISITPEVFKLAEGEHTATFRLSFYAQSSVDGSWDVAYFVFTLDNLPIVLSDGSELGVLTTREAPSIK